MKVTQAQIDALYKVYLRWQNKTAHDIMPREFEVVPSEECPGYIGIWVGTPTDSTPHGSMYLGIEPDGYTHS